MLYYDIKTGDQVSYGDIAQKYNISLPLNAQGPDEVLISKLSLVPIVPSTDKPEGEWYEDVTNSGPVVYTPGDDNAFKEWEVHETIQEVLDENGDVVATREQVRDQIVAEEEAAEAERLADEESTAVRQADEASQNKIDNQRRLRDARLRETDIYSISDWPHADDAARTAWFTYRQELRDLPTHANWPDLEDDDWPTSPDAS